jgi:hypothetical protein
MIAARVDQFEAATTSGRPIETASQLPVCNLVLYDEDDIGDESADPICDYMRLRPG